MSTKIKTLDILKEATDAMSEAPKRGPYSQEFLDAKSRTIGRVIRAVDFQAEASKSFVDEHLDQFVDHAKEIAVSEGVVITVAQPESPAETITVHHT